MKEHVRTVPDYPIPGIQFRDITPLLQDSKLFAQVVDEMSEPWYGMNIDAVLSIEARGFIMAGAIAYKLGAAFIPLRKPDKLPGETHRVSFELEYGKTEMHIHKDALNNQKKLKHIQNKNNILFCGSYFGYGFHEDGIKSSLEMIKSFNDR